MEIFENDSRDNYSKVVLHKQLWIPLGQDTKVTMHESASPDLTAWRARQEAERERIRKLEHTPVPPQRPPKKACLRQSTKLLKSAEETLGLTPAILSEKRKLCQRSQIARSTSDGNVKSPAVTGDWSSDGKHLTSQTSLQIEIGAVTRQSLESKPAKIRPPVPPKPVFEKVSGKYISCRALPEMRFGEKCEGHKLREALENNEEDKEDNPANNENDKENIKRRTLIRSNFWQNQKTSLMDKNSEESEETCEERRSEILSEIDANNESGEAIINLVSECGSMSDVDKLTVHIKEVESVTNLLIVLRERLDRTEEELSQKPGNSANADLLAKKQKLENQLEEAYKLKQFRNKRQEVIKDTLGKFLNSENLLTFKSFLDNKVRLIGLLREVDAKITKQLKAGKK